MNYLTTIRRKRRARNRFSNIPLRGNAPNTPDSQGNISQTPVERNTHNIPNLVDVELTDVVAKTSYDRNPVQGAFGELEDMDIQAPTINTIRPQLEENGENDEGQDIQLGNNGSAESTDSEYESESGADLSTSLKLSSISKKLSFWTSLVSMIIVTGSVRFTRNQYNMVRILIECLTEPKSSNGASASDEKGLHHVKSTLPSYSSVQKAFKPLIQNLVGPRSYDMFYNPQTKTLTRMNYPRRVTDQQGTKIKVVPVSEYARMDIAFPPFLDASHQTDGSYFKGYSDQQLNEMNLREVSSPGLKHWDCVDDWPLLSNREEHYTKRDYINAKRSEDQVTAWRTMNRAYEGDTIRFQIAGVTDLNADLKDAFRCNYVSSEDVTLEGVLSAIMTATVATNTRNESILQSSSGNREYLNILRNVASSFHESSSPFVYTSSRAVNRKHQLFGIGDILALVRSPRLNSYDLFLIIVNRFNLEEGEYEEQVFCVKNREGLGRLNDVMEEPLDVDGNTIADIRDVSVICTSTPTPATFPSNDATSGILEDGRRYFVYRFILFWDGFGVGATTSVSTEGIYLISLNLTSKHRSSSKAVRVVTLLPDSVPISVVLDEILKDIKIGMTTGYEDYDANGRKVVIFLDLVGVIGDTPALNEVLDVKGHTAIACCHLCRFRRLEKEEIELGSGKTSISLWKPRYMGEDVHGGKAYASRSSLVHGALRKIEIDLRTSRRLGMKQEIFLPFLKYVKSFKDISNRIPLTSNALQVVPSCFDSYRSLLIGPDHLFFGLAKDCINAVISILPENSYIAAYERVALAFLSDARSRTQKAIVNMNTKSLFSMSISEIFALLIISEEAFRLGIMITDSSIERESWKVSETCLNAIKLVGSLADITARIWFKPRLAEDGIEVVRRFNANHGISYLRETQRLIETHLQLMRDLSSYENKDFNEYIMLSKKKDSNSKKKRQAIEKELRDISKIVRILDCPNVHRLLEFAHVYLPMFGTSSRLSELEFEKGHQALKRGIENSNNQDSHIQAMSSILCDDWLGRMAMLLSESDMSIDTTRSIIRLLYGREEIARRKGAVTNDDNKQLSDAIGPNSVVKKLFAVCGGKVMSDVSIEKDLLIWKGLPSRENELSEVPPYHGYSPFRYSIKEETSPRNSAFLAQYNAIIKRSKFIINSLYKIGNYTVLERVYSCDHGSANRRKETEIWPGDVIQFIGPKSSLHSPISKSFNLDMSVQEAQVHLYYIICLYEVNDRTEAMVLPCTACETTTTQDHQPRTKDRMELPNRTPFTVQLSTLYVKSINLTKACQRVLIQHQCTKECVTTQEQGENEVIHCEHPLSSTFFVKNREQGFPPRSS